MKAIVTKVKQGPYDGPFEKIEKTLHLKTEYDEKINWHIRLKNKETFIDASIGHIIEGIELTENREGRKVIDYKNSDPRVVNRQFVIFEENK